MIFVECEVDGVTGRHHMIIINNFQKRLDFRAHLLLLFAHFSRNSSRVSVDSSDKSVSIALFIGAVIIILKINLIIETHVCLQTLPIIPL